MTVIHISYPDDRFLRRRIAWCPFEQRNQEMVVRFEEWYAPTVYCCGCGDTFGEDGRDPRPWRRNWRRDAVRRYRKLWDRATYGPPPGLDDFRAEVAS